jgi:hypothetical protein
MLLILMQDINKHDAIKRKAPAVARASLEFILE